MSRRALVSCLLICLVVSLMLSWSAVASAEKVKLTFMSHTYKPWNDALQEQVNRYMQLNPHVEIEYIIVPGEDLWTRLAVMLEAGTGPDIMGVYYPTIVALVNAGRLDPAPDFVVKDIEENFLPFAIEGSKVHGTVYGYIQHIGIQLPIINVDMWNDFGLEPPDTWEEFVETIKKMDVYKNGRLETAGAQFDHWTIDTLIGWSTLLWANGGRYLTEDMKEAAFNSPEGLKATQMYLDLTHPELGEDAFILELAATSYNGPWARSHYRDVAPYLNYKALPPLKGADGEPIAMAYSWLWCVNAGISEEKKLEAWKFLQWLTSAEEYLWMALEAGFVPIRKDNAEDPRVKNDEWLSTFAYALNYGRKYPEHPNWPEIQEAIYKQLQRVFVREISAEEGLRLAEQDVNRILGN